MNDNSVTFDADIESQATMALSDYGVDFKKVVMGFVEKIIKKELTLDEIEHLTQTTTQKRPISDLKGILKGKVWMSDDFNEPMECMKEYMP